MAKVTWRGRKCSCRNSKHEHFWHWGSSNYF